MSVQAVQSNKGVPGELHFTKSHEQEGQTRIEARLQGGWSLEDLENAASTIGKTLAVCAMRLVKDGMSEDLGKQLQDGETLNSALVKMNHLAKAQLARNFLRGLSDADEKFFESTAFSSAEVAQPA